MSFNGAGVFQRIYNWVTDAANNINITDTRMDGEMDGFATGLTNCVTKDGQTTITANLPMSTFRHTGVGNAAARTDYAAAGQIQDSSLVWCGTAGGTKNAITITPTPAITAYATGQEFIFKAGATSSDSAVTIAVSSLATKAAQFNDAALSASYVIEANKYYKAVYDGTAFQLTRQSDAITPFIRTLLDDADASTARTTLGAAGVGLTAGYAQQVDQAVTTVASASSVSLATSLEQYITGTTAVTAFTGVAGNKYHCRTAAALPMTHSADLYILQTGASVTLDAGATFDVYMVDANSCLISNIQLASGRAIVAHPNTIVQVVSTQTGAVATGTTIIPQDDTIPQITEGDEYMTLAITPTKSTNKLEITVTGMFANSASARIIVALFINAGADAIAVSMATPGASAIPTTGVLKHTMIPGTTSAITFRVRAGGIVAGTTTFNGVSSGRLFGGVSASSIVIREITV